MVEGEQEQVPIDLVRLREASKCPRKLALLRIEKLEKKGEGLAMEIVETLKQKVDSFLKNQSDATLLSELLNIHLNLTQNDATFGEELARQGSHRQLLRLVALCPDDDDDTTAEIQDLACRISAEDPKFPQKLRPFLPAELKSRLPLVFELSGQIQSTVLIKQVTARQSAQADVGFVMWPAAVVLAQYLAEHPTILTNAKSVLELGSGCGLVGLAAALIRKDNQSSPVVLTDFNPTVLENLAQNARLNRVDCEAIGLDFYHQSGTSSEGWRDLEGNLQPPVDLVLAADVICQESDAYAAAKSIKDALVSGGKAVVVSGKGGQRFGVEHFFGACKGLGLEIEEESIQQDDLAGLKLTSGYFTGMSLSLFQITKR